MVLKIWLKYIVIRTIVFILTIIVAYSFSFMLLKLMPVDAVEALIQRFLSGPTASFLDPATINALRESLYELFGLRGSLLDQYISFMSRLFKFDFGPSLISFPTPVSELISRALPWTLALLATTTILSWIIGNVLGVLITFLEAKGSSISKILEGIAIVIRPLPYYVMALILIFILAYIVPVFPLPGGGGVIAPQWSLEWILGMLHRLTLPALSLLLVGAFGWWFLSSRTLAQNILSEDFYQYAVLRGLSEKVILNKYILRNILLPQITALGLSLGSIFSGAIIVEAIFALPGLGTLIYRAIGTGDLSTALAVLTLSILGVSGATYILDIIYPLIDPRVRYR